MSSKAKLRRESGERNSCETSCKSRLSAVKRVWIRSAIALNDRARLPISSLGEKPHGATNPLCRSDRRRLLCDVEAKQFQRTESNQEAQWRLRQRKSTEGRSRNAAEAAL